MVNHFGQRMRDWKRALLYEPDNGDCAVKGDILMKLVISIIFSYVQSINEWKYTFAITIGVLSGDFNPVCVICLLNLPAIFPFYETLRT